MPIMLKTTVDNIVIVPISVGRFLIFYPMIKHTRNGKNYYLLLQFGGSPIDIEAKIHMDTSSIHRRPLGAPIIAKKSLKNGFSR